ncbi:MAG: hypothetical protein LW688_02195 [Cryomorphaceae bacterium]|jgi:hypothetical protein|nr:hypothetical protein [Cryomorphaceae bacterium]
MFKKVIIPISATLLFSCARENKEKVLNMSDLTPQAKRDTSEFKKEKDTSHFSLFNLPLADSCGIRLQEYNELKDPMFPDRFMPKSKLKLTLVARDESLLMGQWTYSDSLKTMNAFFNWLDCFGTECTSFKYGEEVNIQKDAMILFINDTSITYFSSKSKLELNNWQRYLEKFYGIDQWDVVIWQQPRKKGVWMKYDLLPGKKKKQFLPLR